MDIQDLKRFYLAYMECALFCGVDNLEHRDSLPYFDASDFAPETKEAMLKDCKKFVEEHRRELAGIDAQSAGSDFWYTRNGHGTGFWDRNLGEIGEILTVSAKRFKEVFLYLGDDGLLYQDNC
jgi:hypothetical protein